MQYTLATLALVAAARVANAQGVASGIAPASAPPAGCSTTYASKFEITVVLPAMKRDVIERRDACGGAGTLVASLTGGVLTDAVGRIGSIVANGQFQFDGPPAQTGAVYTGGWSVCSNGSLALGGSGVFYQCLSGGFYNLYDKSIGGQCSPVEIDVIPCTVGGATQIPDGQVQNPSATTKITQISDGQIQATSAGPHVTQISDGQIQATSAAVRPPPVSQFTDGQIQVTAMPTYRPPPVSQITDGQIQAPTSKPVVVSQITDGQIQAPTTKPVVVSQITDGQIQAPTTKPIVVSQITDGQIQAPTTKPVMTTKPPVVSQITDGQIQAPTTIVTRPLVSQITDGQVQAPNATATPTKPVPGSASRMTMGASIVAAALAVVVFAVL